MKILKFIDNNKKEIRIELCDSIIDNYLIQKNIIIFLYKSGNVLTLNYNPKEKLFKKHVKLTIDELKKMPVKPMIMQIKKI